MSQRKIKITRPSTIPTGSYEEEVAREFREVCTLIDELQQWAKLHAPSEVQTKLALLKSYTVTPGSGKAN